MAQATPRSPADAGSSLPSEAAGFSAYKHSSRLPGLNAFRIGFRGEAGYGHVKKAE